jgi:hypothetical protein
MVGPEGFTIPALSFRARAGGRYRIETDSFAKL